MITITLNDSMNINFVNAIKSMIKAMPKKTYSIKETPKLTENGYTKENEKEILKIIEEHEKEKKKGKIKSFNNINDINRDLEN